VKEGQVRSVRSGFAEAAGEDGVELAVVAGDEEEAVGVETGGDASIAGVAVARLDADALAGDPGAELG
jgi:hypothetical protein